MEIKLENIGRRYNRDWIFSGVNYKFVSGNSYALLGPNGSGKSTLLKILSSSLTPSEGLVHYAREGTPLSLEQIYKEISIAAPYMELIEEFTLQEMLHFHFRFKKLFPGMGMVDLIELIALPGARNKVLRHFSSGMKQRVKLALACCTDAAIVLLDEPTTNLDAKATQWYHALVERFTQNKLLILGSNQAEEYQSCQFHLDVSKFSR